ncbi:MAG: alpha-amylase family glycosyl hydrolase [Nitrospirota bacterium]
MSINEAAILKHRRTHFVLWRPKCNTPKLIIGVFSSGNPCTLKDIKQYDLKRHSKYQDIWELPASDCGLKNSAVYHYWFEVDNADLQSKDKRITVIDPFATTVDYRVCSKSSGDAASVILFQNDQLVYCDPGGEIISFDETVEISTLPANNTAVIYELPASWSRGGFDNTTYERDIGTFRDVLALLDKNEPGANFSDIDIIQNGEHLVDLGINILELLPPADTKSKREWGYAPANYLAPDFDMGFPEGNISPTSGTDLIMVIDKCHKLKIRFFTDMVMAFGYDSYKDINFPEFHLNPKEEIGNPDSYQSSRNNELRDGFGGNSWRYQNRIQTCDPLTGNTVLVNPASQFMLTQLRHWMQTYHIDGIRIDSVNNIASWNFIHDFTKEARSVWNQRWDGKDRNQVDERFLVLGEELNVPLELLYQGRLDALWNESFQQRVRAAIIGEGYSDNFEWTVRRMIDCRLIGFLDGSQAINYITSHDIEGNRKERLYNFLENCNIYDKSPRIKLAFVCLMTAVGIPMILAGEEFADQHDLPIKHPDKQQDPVNYSRCNDSWRRDIFEYVARLVKLRTSSPALAVNDTDFIHVDFDGGRRVLAWVRGRTGIDEPVVVVANFSEHGSFGSTYPIHNWPHTPTGRSWREVTQQRNVPQGWVGNEPVFPWEAKVYTLV